MSEYRDDARAARLRIDTLEAQLAERDASLRARDAELREAEGEMERLRAIASSELRESELRGRDGSSRMLAAGQTAFLGVVGCVLCAAAMSIALVRSCPSHVSRRHHAAMSAHPSSTQGLASSFKAAEWKKASAADLRTVAEVCRRVGDKACEAEAVRLASLRD
jgi:hypothetical protein